MSWANEVENFLLWGKPSTRPSFPSMNPQYSQCTIVFPVRTVSQAEHQKRINGADSLWYPKGTSKFATLNVSCLGFTTRKSAPIGKNPADFKLPVYTNLNGMKSRHHAKFRMSEIAGAQLERLELQRDLACTGVVMHQVSADVTAGTGKMTSYDQSPCVSSGSYSIQTCNKDGVAFLPGTMVRWTLPYLIRPGNINKALTNYGFTDKPPKEYSSCPGIVFPELEEVVPGSKAQGDAAVAYPLLMHLILRPTATRTDTFELAKLCASLPEGVALREMLYASQTDKLFYSLLEECRDYVACKGGYAHRDTYCAISIDGREYRLDDTVHPYYPEGNAEIVIVNIDDDIDKQTLSVESVQTAFARPFQHHEADRYCPGQLIFTQSDTYYDITDKEPFKTMFAEIAALSANAQIDTSKRAQYHEMLGLTLCENLLVEVAAHNRKYPTARLGLARATHTTKFMKVSDDILSLPHFNHWCSSLISCCENVTADLRRRELGRVIEDNGEGIVTICLKV